MRWSEALGVSRKKHARWRGCGHFKAEGIDWVFPFTRSIIQCFTIVGLLFLVPYQDLPVVNYLASELYCLDGVFQQDLIS